MPIQTGDILLLESATMSDAAEGGGAMTGNVIVDGQSNNIFEDISSLDRAFGAVHMRKIFPSVNIQTVDKYFGSHLIISKLPKDTKIGINLFNTKDWFDLRPAAASRVENYRAKGSKYNGFLWATQFTGSKVLNIFQSETSSVPGVGDVLFLTGNSGVDEQYVRITKFSDSIQTFTDGSGTFTRRILALEISAPLEADFIGSEVSRVDTITPDATILNTVVANAAKYYSARYLAVAGAANDLSLKVDSVFSQVIPSSLQELAITDADAGGTSAQLLDSANGTVSFQFAANFAPNVLVYMGSPCLPDSLSIPITGGTITDSGGQLKSGAVTIGTIDYSAGVMTFGATSPTYTGTKTITFRPAAAPVVIADTATQAVTPSNRSSIWNLTISPPPEPGSLRVSYIALGEWYDIYDNGSGGINGLEANIGTGTVNYATGTVSVTLAVLPDADSSIVYSWGAKATYFNRSTFTAPPATYKFQLTETGIARSTLVITWNDGVARTASADNSGVITGDATGTLNHTTGVLELTPNLLPLGGSTFTCDYQFGAPLSQTFSHPIREVGGDLLIDLNTANLVTNSVEVEWNTFTDVSVLTPIEIVVPPVDPINIHDDDGLGALEGIAGSIVDYVAGTVRWNPDVTISIPLATYIPGALIGSEPELDGAGSPTGNSVNTYRQQLDAIIYQNAASLYPNDLTGLVTIRYRVTDSPTVKQDLFVANSLDIDITDQFAEKIVPGSVRFQFGTKTYIDRLGSLFFDVDNTNDSATFAGTIDYTSGNMNITNWEQGSTNTIAIESLMTGIAVYPVEYMSFRVPSAPVVPQSLQIRVNTVDTGAQITATADASGFISTADMDGFVIYATGLVNIRFGAWVVAAGNEAEPWYTAGAVRGDGMIFKPRHVLADTMLYNATSQSFLPLDAAILGLDPVRLPEDGRVPIYQDGDLIVVLHDQITVGTYINAQVLNLGRGRIAKLSIRDSANQEILASTYTADLDAGTITFIDLTGISQPLTITDRIEDMVTVSDVQITGTLTLTSPLTHTFPVNETLVSNAVIFGDLYAHTSIPFDQATWNGVWSDVLIGSETTAQYNNTLFPIVVDNANCIQERWNCTFISTNTVNVIGENTGQILSGVSITLDIAPINLNTGQAYFTIPSGGWGSGWSTGNVLRFNTVAANAPAWLIQSVNVGDATDPDFDFCVELRGDVNTP